MSDSIPKGGRRWLARPLSSWLIRSLALALPIVCSVGVVYLATRAVGPPVSSLPAYLGWWMALAAASTIAMTLIGRVSRRLLPLAALLKLSLVFPDTAPSRFRTALRWGTVKSLEDRLAEARRGATEATPAEAAQRLLVLAAALDTHDNLTRGHSERVRAYSQMIGRELGLRPRELELLNWAALLHDIGKLEVPRGILTKKGQPTDEEWVILRRHTELGQALVEPLRVWLGRWCDAVGDHHERWDGSGYPNGTAGNEISLAGRIVAVADVFDVITSSRSYKQGSTASAGRAEIARCAGSQFDPEIVRAFLAVSVGRVRLATGPLAWLAEAPILARATLTPAAGTLAAAAVAVGVNASPNAVVDRSGRPADGRSTAPYAAPAARSALPSTATHAAEGSASGPRQSGAAGQTLTASADPTPPGGQPTPPRAPTPEPPGTPAPEPPRTTPSPPPSPASPPVSGFAPLPLPPLRDPPSSPTPELAPLPTADLPPLPAPALPPPPPPPLPPTSSLPGI
jgi:putative nucleotidyltransferase with HDIG domain